ncbi:MULTISPECIES: hypothetical protein [Amycolatopsis]|uniref:Uncharacterized protein n=1 Tax=Amycolatopsis albidoflavus TaxID=102226 RepID=A0ABW5HX11_9PSEU
MSNLFEGKDGMYRMLVNDENQHILRRYFVDAPRGGRWCAGRRRARARRMRGEQPDRFVGGFTGRAGGRSVAVLSAVQVGHHGGNSAIAVSGGLQAEFSEDAVGVLVGRFLGDEQKGGDGAMGWTLDFQCQNLQFAGWTVESAPREP